MGAEEEHRDTMDSDERDAELASPSIDQDAPTRRDFLIKSAEVAAFSLFGVTAFDALAQKVLSRAAEIDGLETIARSALTHLEESGVVGVAHALEGGCAHDPAEPYQCASWTQPAFDGCGATSYDFACEWSKDIFFCDMSDEGCWDFECINNFACPPVPDGFFCPGTSDFDCDYPAPFSCGDSAAGYLCPSTAEFYPACQGQWDCNPNQEFAECDYDQQHTFACGSGETGDYTCGEEDQHTTAWFTCGDIGGGGTHKESFSCADCATYFSCEGDSATGGPAYDFTCANGGGFTCGDTGDGLFDCSSNHIFLCGGDDHTFDCDGDSFTCSAGGTQCNVGQTGGYTFDAPGDFRCEFQQEFDCSHSFDCAASDDFACGWQSGDFDCVAPFEGCAPHGNGSFVCKLGSGFQCVQLHANFECAATMVFSQTY